MHSQLPSLLYRDSRGEISIPGQSCAVPILSLIATKTNHKALHSESMKGVTLILPICLAENLPANVLTANLPNRELRALPLLCVSVFHSISLTFTTVECSYTLEHGLAPISSLFKSPNTTFTVQKKICPLGCDKALGVATRSKARYKTLYNALKLKVESMEQSTRTVRKNHRGLSQITK